jgi:hypothetical protein
VRLPDGFKLNLAKRAHQVACRSIADGEKSPFLELDGAIRAVATAGVAAARVATARIPTAGIPAARVAAAGIGTTDAAAA